MALALAPSLVAAADPPAAAKPNVLLLISDDLNCTLGCYGDPLVKTPNVDRLAARGVRFERAYCQFPLCNPSRASFMTGLRPERTGVRDNGVHFRKKVPGAATLPQWFRRAGYRADRIGKIFHYGVPDQIGTDGLDDPESWDSKFNPRGRDKDDEPDIFSLIPGKFGGTLSWFADEGEDSDQTDGKGAGEAIRLLEERAKDGKPFFLAVGFYRPHTPYVAPKKYFDMYPPEKIPLPENPPGSRDAIPRAALTDKKEEQAMSDDLRRRAIQAYHAATTFMDAQAGRVLDALDRLGLAGNTIVAFTSDHGYLLGEHQQWQKMSLFEPSTRVPLIFAGPGVKARGKSTAALTELVDLYPTLADLAGLEPSPGLDGRSLRPQLEDPAAPGKAVARTEVTRRGASGEFLGRSVRTDRWRYTEWDGGAQGAELYDHAADPDEKRNLASDPACAADVAAMKSILGEAAAKGN